MESCHSRAAKRALPSFEGLSEKLVVLQRFLAVQIVDPRTFLRRYTG
jgi:hypothetical protein